MPLKVLISGAGVAGPACAFWLNRLSTSPIKTTIIERYNGLRKGGQQIDIRGAGVQVIKRMGMEEAIRSNVTREEGLAFVDASGRKFAEFPVQEGVEGFTSEIEIVREKLVNIFYNATKDNTEYVFGSSIEHINQDNDKATVRFDNGVTRDFDLIIGADGQWSKTRKLAFPDGEDPVRKLGQFVSFFSIPYESRDGTYSKWYNAEGGRSFLLRPDNAGCTRAFMSIMTSKLEGFHKLPVPEQKAKLEELFTGSGWEAERVIKGMIKSNDFYLQEIAQVKLPSWSHHRVALIGDAGYCPSLISGLGTTVAIVGAYILAGEIARSGKDFKAAFRKYEERMRPFVTKAQKLPPGAPAIWSPQSKLGVKLANSVISFAAWTRIFDLINKVSTQPGQFDDLPTYELTTK
ncbi:hypothetical protein K3495_g12065 [Podosphaera aphanis]|nr:hypothetical protein K3495_g12065 [Podosphaera aphanis]